MSRFESLTRGSLIFLEAILLARLHQALDAGQFSVRGTGEESPKELRRDAGTPRQRIPLWCNDEEALKT
jgi:hypothetical protein